MTDVSHGQHRPRRLFRMPQRKSFWLYDYDQVKYRTPLQWGALLIISLVFAVFGSVAAWAVVIQYTSKHTVDTR